MENMISKARELGKLIGESQEMESLKSAEAALEADAKSQELLNEFKTIQIEMVNAAKDDKSNDVTEEIKGRLLAKQEEINEYEVTKKYIQAKATFDNMMKTINDVIIYSITGEEPCSPHKCSSCGGGCGG